MIASSQSYATALQIIASAPRSISDLLKDGKFYAWQAEEIQSGSYSRNPDDRDRFSRCYDAAQHGSDGSTHAEHIEDVRAYGTEVYRQLNHELFRCFGEDLTDDQEADLQDALDLAQADLDADCDHCEQWHEQNGSLDQQTG